MAKTRAVVALGAAVAVAAGLSVYVRSRLSEPAGSTVPSTRTSVVETFGTNLVNPLNWEIVRQGAFTRFSVEPSGASRLKLGLETLGTPAGSEHLLGVRRREPLSMSRPLRISTELDWNHPANGSYLSAGLVLAGAESEGSPLEGPDWIKVEYVGVPPGKTGRLVVASRSAGVDRNPYLDGWPMPSKEGRALGVQRIELRVRDGGFEVWENGRVKVAWEGGRVSMKSGYVYLYVASRSNYGLREVLFSPLTLSFD